MIREQNVVSTMLRVTIDFLLKKVFRLSIYRSWLLHTFGDYIREHLLSINHRMGPLLSLHVILSKSDVGYMR